MLEALPSYVPGDAPTVPGHEVVCEIVAVGEGVERHEVGERVLVQADWRFVRTASSNGAFGYNFEGGLQEYVLFDERIVVDPDTDQRYLLPVGKDQPAAAVCLVEPWACVECSYVTEERGEVKAGGRLLVVAEADHAIEGVGECFPPDEAPGEIVAVLATDAHREQMDAAGLTWQAADDVAALPDEGFDDIIYFGAVKGTIDALNDKLAAGGIINVVLAGRRIGQPVSVGVGRVHYGPTRWIGTVETSAVDSYKLIPHDGEIRDGESIAIIGAGGPMGQMHTIRAASTEASDVSVLATDLDDERLDALRDKVASLAEQRGVELELLNTKSSPLEGEFSYVALMAPVGQLVADAINHALPHALINIFAGIPAGTRQDLDLDAYIRNRCFMFGTSGSRIADMQRVLEKVNSGQLETNRSVDAVCGMAGAVDGIRAVEARTMAGKIIVYPELHDLPLTPLDELGDTLPDVAAKLDDGVWTAAAEAELLKAAR